MSINIEKAEKFATHAHEGAYMEPERLPYILHVKQVVHEVWSVLCRNQNLDLQFAIQVAYLHDVVEDTVYNETCIENMFGEKIADAVLALTKNRQLSKTAQLSDSLNRIIQQPTEVAVVKMADRVANLQTPQIAWSAEKKQRYHADAIKILNTLGHIYHPMAVRLQAEINIYEQRINK